mmetsp:Transcript_10876/g.11009  ORF Transcript_10876/g.11009 Transcript_10876/m.11009 type:complete len:85 (+) Transcript_10876:283-537(+)
MPRNQFFNFIEVNKFQRTKWLSPFMNLKSCFANRKENLARSVHKNFEKSFNVNNSMSLNAPINSEYKIWQNRVIVQKSNPYNSR